MYRTYTRVLQCSHASVGLAQARPNKSCTNSCWKGRRGLTNYDLWPLSDNGLPALHKNSQKAPGSSVEDSGVRIGREQPAKVYCTNETEEVGRGWPLWNKLPGVITNWLLYLNRQAFLAFTKKGPACQIKAGSWIKSISNDPKVFYFTKVNLVQPPLLMKWYYKLTFCLGMGCFVVNMEAGKPAT